MAPLDMTSILKDCEGKWVALSDDSQSVYGIGKSAKEALEDSKSKGYSDVTLMFVQPSDMFYCGIAA